MKTRTKLFFILWISAIISSALILPYILKIQSDLLEKAGVSLPFLIFVSLLQGAIIFGLASILGLILAEKTGFKIPLITSWIERKKINYSKTLVLSIILGIIVGILILFIDKFVFQQSISSLMKVEPWKGFLACFYGGIAEEIIMRLFLMSLFVFLLMKLTNQKKTDSVIVWASIIIVSVLFGLGHLPITASVIGITPMVVFRAILLNGIGGVVFGWLYWKKGLESAMISHFFADIILHVIAAY